MNCLICDRQIEAEITWTTIFKLRSEPPICHTCTNQFTKIGTPTCRYCGRDDQQTCTDCLRWEKRGLMTMNRAVYRYNEFLKETITRFKYRGDYALVEAFSAEFATAFKYAFPEISKSTRLVPIPLSDARAKVRAFNQAEALANLLPYQTVSLLKRTTGEKQAKKNRHARLAMANPFELNDEIEPGPVVIIDDIYTTGATIHHAARVLKHAGCQQISSFTLAR